jgi:hypothetical protein
MVTAEELIKKQKEKDDNKKKYYNKIYNFIENKIILASSNNLYHTWYEIPHIIIGMPLYSLDKCQEYIQKKLKKNGFETSFYEPNILLIEWIPKK